MKPLVVLVVLCDEHREEEEFLLDTTEILALPSPTLEVFRKARGVETVSMAQTDTHSESEASNIDSKPRRSIFSVEPERRKSSVLVSRAGSVQRDSGVQHVYTPEAGWISISKSFEEELIKLSKVCY